MTDVFHAISSHPSHSSSPPLPLLPGFSSFITLVCYHPHLFSFPPNSSTRITILNPYRHFLPLRACFFGVHIIKEQSILMLSVHVAKLTSKNASPCCRGLTE